jgi:hypothetical protein
MGNNLVLFGSITNPLMIAIKQPFLNAGRQPIPEQIYQLGFIVITIVKL